MIIFYWEQKNTKFAFVICFNVNGGIGKTKNYNIDLYKKIRYNNISRGIYKN